jgi:hypothetical protein
MIGFMFKGGRAVAGRRQEDKSLPDEFLKNFFKFLNLILSVWTSPRPARPRATIRRVRSSHFSCITARPCPAS